jgi:putative glutamine amidotransferase
MINVLLGGTLVQDIETELGVSHPNDVFHSVKAAEGSIYENLYGAEFIVNSFHHQALDRLGDGLVVEARAAESGIVEAARHENLPVMGVQWHPERMCGPGRYSKEGPDMAPLLEHFVKICKTVKETTR